MQLNTILATNWHLGFYMLFLNFLSTYADLSRYCGAPRFGKMSYSGTACGQTLANLVSEVCNFRLFEGTTITKRNHASLGEQERFPDDAPFLSKPDALAHFQKRTSSARYGQGLSCECCQNQCSPKELMEYCAYDDDVPSVAKRSVDAPKLQRIVSKMWNTLLHSPKQ